MILLLSLVNRLLKILYLIANHKCTDAAAEAEKGYRMGVERLEKYYKEEGRK